MGLPIEALITDLGRFAKGAVRTLAFAAPKARDYCARVPRDTICIDDLRVECVIGVYPSERTQTQPISLNLKLYGDLSPAGFSGSLSDSCDYDRLADEIAHLLRFRQYELLEMAAEEVSAMIFGLHPWVQELWLKIAKPKALGGRAARAAVQMRRRASDYPRGFEKSSFGTVDVLFESKGAGLYLLNVEPGQEIAPHYHNRMQELEWLVRGELLRDGKAICAPSVVIWPQGQVHHYRNESAELATLFCCDKPPFIPEDEIEVERP